MRRILLATCLLVVGFAACTPPPPDCSTTGITTQRNVRYTATTGVTANLQSLDLYLPVRPAGCAPTPLVVYVHGGGFVTGDKGNQIADKRDLFTGEGWALASLNYRLVGAPGVGPGNGVYPAPEQDIAAALSYLQAHAAANRTDPTDVMLLGHSAGAFLVALEGTDGQFLGAVGLGLPSVTCVAPLDTTYDIANQIAGGGTSEAMFRNAFGNDPAVWAKASPTHHAVAGTGIPDFHIVTRGPPDRVQQAQAFAAQLRGAGVAAQAVPVIGLSHEQVNDAVGAPGDTRVTPALMAFYRGCVAGAGAGAPSDP